MNLKSIYYVATKEKKLKELENRNIKAHQRD